MITSIEYYSFSELTTHRGSGAMVPCTTSSQVVGNTQTEKCTMCVGCQLPSMIPPLRKFTLTTARIRTIDPARRKTHDLHDHSDDRCRKPSLGQITIWHCRMTTLTGWRKVIFLFFCLQHVIGPDCPKPDTRLFAPISASRYSIH